MAGSWLRGEDESLNNTLREGSPACWGSVSEAIAPCASC